MNINQFSPGKNVPDDINVIIEIPANGDPVKYEVDKDTGALVVDRFMGTAMYYPTNYGYIPQTLGEDGDPTDVLVLTPSPLISGSVVNARPVGVLKMIDESGIDFKILAVPQFKLTQIYSDIKDIQDISSHLLNTIEHFFKHYKDLEDGKWVKVEKWDNVQAAKEEIIKSIERYNT